MKESVKSPEKRHIENPVMAVKTFHILAIGNHPADIDDTVGICMAVIGAALNILKNIGCIKLNGDSEGKSKRYDQAESFPDSQSFLFCLPAKEKQADARTCRHQCDPQGKREIPPDQN